MQSTILCAGTSCVVTACLAGTASAQSWIAEGFSSALELSAPGSDRPRHVALADLDGDGDSDLAVASDGDQRIAWYEQTSPGVFAARRDVSVGVFRASALRAGDVEGDGDIDLVLSSESTPALSGPPTASGLFWLENLGAGQFAAHARPLPLTPLDSPSELALGDIDGDGDLDVVAASYQTGVVSLWRFGGGGFDAPQAVGQVGAFGATGVTLGDLDGDGLADVIVAVDDSINWSGRALYFRNLGGAFGAGVGLAGTVRAFGVAAADLDADGDLDVLVGREDGVSISFNNGAGQFGPVATQVAFGIGVGRPGAADIDGDGDLDLTVTGDSGAPFHWVPQTNPGSFGAATLVDAGPGTFAIGDVDGDGQRDLVGGQSNSYHVFWRRNLGGGVFDARRELGAPPLLSPNEAQCADMDLDGDLDALAVGGDGSVVWFENLGGTFGSAQPIGVVAGANRVEAADLDGDGDIDVLASGQQARWFARQGAGFSQGTLLLSPARDATPADLDGDGILDVLFARDTTIAWRRGTGGGAFQNVQTIAALFTSTPGDVHAADFDGDGDLDVLAVGNSIEPVAYVENRGNGSFGPVVVLDLPFAQSPAARVGAADIDGDGRLDAIAGGRSYFWWRNLGGGTFGPFAFIASFGGLGAGFAARDLDGDGDTDFAFCYDNGEQVVLWRVNVGGGTFSGNRLVTAAQTVPRGLAAGDLDGDGDVDLVCASDVDHTVALVRNQLGRSVRACSPAVPNQTGQSAIMETFGSVTVSANDLTLVARRLPVQSTGYFLASRAAGFVAMPGGSRGDLCLGGAIGRFTGPGQVGFSGSFGGHFALRIDLAALPTPVGPVAVMPGETWFFQAWYRDSFQGAATSNFTDSIALWFE